MPRAWLLVSALALCGCGGSQGTGAIKGKVIYKGSIVPEGQVSFLPGTGIPFTVEIRSDGTYEVEGVPVGEAIVTVVRRPADHQSPAERLAARRQKLDADAVGQYDDTLSKTRESLLPEFYMHTDTSDLRITVETGMNVFNINLLDKPMPK